MERAKPRSLAERRVVIRDAAEMGTKTACEKHGIALATYYAWKTEMNKGKKPKRRKASKTTQKVNEVLAGIDSRKHAVNDADPLEAVLRLANGARRVEFHRIIVERE